MEASMTLRWVRLGLGAFIVFSITFAANLMLFQPAAGRLAAAKSSAQLAVQADRSDDATASARAGVVILNAREPAIKTGAIGARTAPVPSQDITASKIASDGPEVVRAVQRELQIRGYETGTPDGMPGLVTRAAIMAFESDHGLQLTGEPSDGLLQRILLGTGPDAKRASAGNAGHPTPEAEQVIRTVQQSLTSLGYTPGVVDGRLGDQTLRTIRDFERDQGLTETGRISGQLVARLARLAGQGRIADKGKD